MGKINKKTKKLTEVIDEKSKNQVKDLKHPDGGMVYVSDKSRNILPMKLKESPKISKKSEKDTCVDKNIQKIASKQLVKSSGTAKIKDKNLNKITGKDKTETQEKPKNIEPSEKDKRTIFIGNLPANIKRKQLEALLLPYGKLIKCRFRLPIMGKPILKHKMAVKAGALNAYAELSSIEEAQNALKLNGTEYKSHHLRVTKSTEKFNPNSMSPDQVKCTIFIGNLKYSASDEALYNIFSSCGEIEYCRTLNNSKGCKGVAYVCFKNSDSVGLALELNGTLLEDRPIAVSKYSLNTIKECNKKGKKEEPKMNGFMQRVVKKFIKDEKVDPATMLDKNRLYKKNKNLKNSEKLGKIKKANKKKIEFRGVEVKSKKKFKSKSKGNNMLKDLAKKIAPKEL